MITPVFIAGAGVISAIGNNIPENLAALENETAGMGEMRYLRSVHHHKLPVAEVKMSNAELAELAGMPAHISRTALLSAIAAKYGKSPAQVLIRWNLQRGTVPMPKANRRRHLEGNIDVFDFQIGDEDMAALNGLNERYSSLGVLPYR